MPRPSVRPATGPSPIPAPRPRPIATRTSEARRVRKGRGVARIAVGGFQHETNTFAPSKARYEDFLKPGAWPGLTRGEAMFGAVEGINLPAAGFVAAARAAGHELVPLAWANATPSAHVTGDAFERIAAMVVADLAEAKPVDAVYLDIHGAMVTEHL